MTIVETKPAPMTAADVRAAIQSQYGDGGGQYAVLFEVRNGTAWRANRSVDAVVMSLWPSLGMELWGMEIKVSRSDWRRELEDPAKASEVFDYFDRWFLIAPEHVAKPDELPGPWGWLVPEQGGLRKVRDAAKNPNVKAVDRHFLGALLRRVAKTDDAFIAAAVDDALRRQRQTLESELEQRSLKQLGELKEAAKAWMDLREALKVSDDHFIYQPEVIEAVSLVMRSGVAKSWGGIQSLVAEVNRMKENLDKIAGDLGIKQEPTRRRRR